MSGCQTLSVLPVDAQQMSVCKKEPPEQHEWSPRLDQEDTKPSHIKEEQEEFGINNERDQLQGQEEADIKLPFSPIPVKTEENEDKPQSLLLYQIKTEQIETGAAGEECGITEQAKSSDPERHLHSEIEVMIEDYPEPVAEVCKNGNCTTVYQSGLNSVDRVKDKGSKTNGVYHSCSECDQIFIRKCNLTNHMRIHTREEPLGCSKCSARFNSKTHLERHMRIHMVKKILSCPECGKGFKLKSSLKAHLRAHKEKKPVSCPECGKGFRDRGNLTAHLRTHTGEKPFSCPECGKSYRRKSHMMDHLRSHTGETPFSCPECGKRFNRKESVSQHMLVHKEKPFSCSECGKTFNFEGLLRQHMKIHTVSKPFSCTECGKAFQRMVNLTQHMCVHTEQKTLVCSECGKEFGDRHSLKRHMMIHTDERPFSCSECTKSFRNQANLNKHMRVHTGEKPLSCTSCHQRFRWQAQLRKHKCICVHASAKLKTQVSLKEQVETEADGEYSGGSEGGRHLDPDGHLHSEIEVTIEDYSEPDDS